MIKENNCKSISLRQNKKKKLLKKNNWKKIKEKMKS